MKIRKAVIKDVPELATLMEQLGYPTTVDVFCKKKVQSIAVYKFVYTA